MSDNPLVEDQVVNEDKNSGILRSESQSHSTLNAALAITGEWQAEMHGQNVLAANGQMMICNVRGWGYLTGQGALNLPDDRAVAIQDAIVRLIASAQAMYIV